MTVRESTCIVLTLACVLFVGAPGQARADNQAERIARLIEQLGDSDFDKQNDAQRQLEKVGEPAQSALLAAMDRHEDITVRAKAQLVFTRICTARAARLVARLGADNAKAREAAEKELRQVLQAGKDERVKGKNGRFEVLLLADKAKRALLQAEREDSNPEVRERAMLIVLGVKPVELLKATSLAVAEAIHPDNRVSALIEQLGAEDFDVRERASKALVRIGEPALDALRKARSHKDPEVKSRAQKAISQIEEAEEQKVPPNKQVSALIEQLGDDNFNVRERASRALVRIGEPALGALRQARSSEDLEVRRRAKLAIEEIEKARK